MYYVDMEFIFSEESDSDLTIKMSSDEFIVIRRAIRRILLQALRGRETEVAPDAGPTLLHFYDFTASPEQSRIGLQGKVTNLSIFGSVLRASMADFDIDDTATASQIIDDIKGAEVELQARQICPAIPDCIPDDLFR